MFGAVFGDIIGSYYEWYATKDYNFNMFQTNSHFTDDTVMIYAVCNAILDNDRNITILTKNSREKEYALRFKTFYSRYKNAGFGEMFKRWAISKELYINRSYANGASMRIAPIAYAYDTIEQVHKQSNASCAYTHNNFEAKTGARAVSSAIFLALHDYDKTEIQKYIEKNFKYKFDVPIDRLKEKYSFQIRTLYSVPQSIQCFLESKNYEDAVRKAISLGGDADTMACISGGIAEAYYKKIPESIYSFCMSKLDGTMKDTMIKFSKKYVPFYKTQ